MRYSITYHGLLFTQFNFVVGSDYNNNTDLHIAVTTSQGVVVEFDSHGLRRHMNNETRNSWEQSLVLESIPEAWWDYWDEVLSKVLRLIKLKVSS